MRVKEKNSDIITVRSVLNHVRSKRVCVFYSLLFLALLEVREADASHRSHRNVARANSSFSSARNARAGGFGGGFRASYLNVVKRLMSPRRSFKRLNSDWTVVVAALTRFFLLLLSRLFSTLTMMMIPRIQTLTMRSLSSPPLRYFSGPSF